MTTLVTAISARLEAKFAVELAGIEDLQLHRRCADIPELLAVIESGGADIAAISPDFPGMSGSIVSELVVRGASVLAVTSATSALDQRQCEAWGITQSYVVGDGNLADILRRLVETSTPQSEPEPRVPDESADMVQGKVICVWGPAGSPGRSTTALHIARRLGSRQATLLVDADTCAPSLGILAGLADGTAGILALARMAEMGSLNGNQLQSAAAHIEGYLDLVSGIGSGARWNELPAATFTHIIDIARERYQWIVLDISSEFMVDEDLMFDTLAPARHGVSSTAMAMADHIVAIAACDPLGLARFVSSWDDVKESDATVHVVLNKSRRQAVGGDPEVVASGALSRFAGVDVDILLPDARQLLDDEALLGVFAKRQRDNEYDRAIADLVNLIAGESAEAFSDSVSRVKRRRMGRAARLRAS